MKGKYVSIETKGHVCTVILDRPEKRNAVDREVATELLQAFQQFDRDESLRVAVFYGAGGNFSAGGDLTSVGDMERQTYVDPEGREPGPLGPSRMFLSKPVIAAVAGYAVAGGLELALMCDLRVAEEDAVFGVFCRRWGVPLIDGGTVRLPRIVGQGRALDMILTGRPVGAHEAEQMGLATRVVANGQARAVAEEMAAAIAGFPQQCMLADRRSTYQQWGFSLAEALRQEGLGGYPIIAAESVAGAGRFVRGAGRHGSFED